MNIFDHYRQRYEAAKDEEFTLQEFLTTCRQDRSAYANAAERLLMAIGEPVMVDTAQEPRLSRLFSNRVIARYPVCAITSFSSLKSIRGMLAGKKR